MYSALSQYPSLTQSVFLQVYLPNPAKYSTKAEFCNNSRIRKSSIKYQVVKIWYSERHIGTEFRRQGWGSSLQISLLPFPSSLYPDLLVVFGELVMVFGNLRGYLRKITNVLTIWILNLRFISEYLKRETKT